MSNQKKQYVNIGAMLEKKETDKNGKATYYIKIDDKVEVKVNGQKVTALNISRPGDKFEFMLAKDKITEQEYEQKVARYEKDGDLNFVKFELSAALEKK